MSDEIDLDPQVISEVIRSKRFLAADRAKLDGAAIRTWDRYLLRELRLLVPMDVQALYIPPGSTEEMVRLPMLLADAGREPDDAMPAPFSAGTPRPAGVHLHWAMPDALLRGALTERADGTTNRLGLPQLPDRWVVLRILLPNGAIEPAVTGWVLEADRAVAVPLTAWGEGSDASDAAKAAGVALAADELTGTVGGSVVWSGVYDAVLNRFAFHDPLDDVAAVAPSGVDQDAAAYVVAGWWRDPADDPLDAARSTDSLHELLDRLRWRLLYEWGDAKWELDQAKAEFELKKALGLTTEERWMSKRPPPKFEAPGARGPAACVAATTADFTAIDKAFTTPLTQVAGSAFVTETDRRFIAQPWHLRSSLLHGAVYGVPVAGPVLVDRRPSANAVRVALGRHDDDVIAALASSPSATVTQRRDAERLLGAFTSQKINRLGSPDGLVELEEHEHGAGFSSVAGGIAGTDRFVQRVQTGGVGGHRIGRSFETMASGIVNNQFSARPGARGQAAQAPGGTSISMQWNERPPSLVKATALQVHDIARSRVGDVLKPVEPRVVNRPAARFTFPDDPLVAVRGGGRSRRHGDDGRGSADGKLTCRWPTHVITEISGLIAKDRFIRSLGSGAVPTEVLTLAREALLHDPYHDAWVARAVSPDSGTRGAVFRRLQAESAVRFGVDGTYDGATQALLPGVAQASPRRRAQARAAAAMAPGMQQRQRLVADELLRFSLVKGADPDLVGVTTWAQPWIPLWLEWEVTIDGLDPSSIEGWRLGQIDLERAADAGTTGSSRTLTGRSLLTTGASKTIHQAIHRWLEAEKARDEVQSGEASDPTEEALASLADAVVAVDIVTAALDGFRHQLLGLDAVDGLRRPASSKPAPVTEPTMLVDGNVRLDRARLLDAFGRTLDVPVDAVAVPTRADVDDDPGALRVAPRLVRPSRWQFRLVDAATPTGAEGTEARVDQVEASLQVSPVAGFVLPDHLDESLEVFAADGRPLGELLHEAVSGGVTWEIAPGREGPADSGPAYGLLPSEQPLAWFASGLVAADATARAGAPAIAGPTTESALSALLRAIDTTLWTVDTFASLGSEHVAGLVGRPIAVVRAQLRLELQPPDDLDLSDPARAAEWAREEEALAQVAFPVRIGELTRTDDGVLGFFVDDDYSRFRLVDKAIAATAAESGRSRGQLGLYASTALLPAVSAIDHPYIAGTDDADTLSLHVGQTVTLTIFMHPAGKASLTSGILPRKALALARDWVGPGLAAIAPSLRTGPVLVETDLDIDGQVRLPKVSVFGTDQNFWWRDTPATWRSDAILAATQTALLPDTPGELREGWIRVAPTPTPPEET